MSSIRFVRLYNQYTGHTHWYEPNLLLSFFMVSESSSPSITSSILRLTTQWRPPAPP
jgi:hypothetical protein